ncbi:unnamed protein product [Calypogeia fissa]
MDVKATDDSQTNGHTSTLQKVFPMAGGHGEESYTKNSGLQALVTNATVLALFEALEQVTLPSNGSPVVVADLGCSSGPNTIVDVARIVDKLRERLPAEDTEFQAYFNDLPSNDFNNLFQLLSNDSRAKDFHTAGVPGSFFGRLFPKASVHVFHAAVSGHWLSKVPDAVLDKESAAYNKGRSWIRNAPSAVTRCFQQQALEDLKSFLLARAAELAPGGLLFFYPIGRTTSDPNESMNDFLDNLQPDLDEILSDLVAEGLLTEEQHDTFNIPVYQRSIDDIKEALECCGSMFNLVITKMHKFNIAEGLETTDATDRAKQLKGAYKAVYNSKVEAQFGKTVADVIWQRYENMLVKKLGLRSEFCWFCIVGLIRN